MPPRAASFIDGFEEVELDAVMGCDSAARMFVVVASANLLDSGAEGEWRMPVRASPEDIDWCTAPSSPSSCNEGLLTEAAALEQPEASLVMAIALQAEVPRRSYGWDGSASRR